MSEISINILIHNNDPAVLQQAAIIIGDYDQENKELGYSVVSRTDLDKVILAELLGGGSVDTDTLLSRLRKLKPECYGLEIYPDDGSKIAPVYFKNGRKVKKNTVINTLRKECLEFDLYYALEKADKTTVQKILQNKTINADIAIGGIPLIFLVIESDDVQAFKLLLERGADIDAAIGSDIQTENRNGEYVYLDKGTTLLMAAVHFSSPKIAAWLIEHGSDINAVDRNGDSALTLMTEEMCMHDLMPVAIEAGADVNHEDNMGVTPLFGMLFASGKSQKYIIDHCKRLMDLGADIGHVSRNGMNARWAAHMAEFYEEQRKIVAFVESHGVTDCHAPDNYYSRKSSSPMIQLRWCMDYNDLESFAKIFDTAGLTLMEISNLLHQGCRKPKEPFIRYIFTNGVPGFVLYDEGTIEALTEDNELRDLLKQRLDASQPERQAYVERCRRRALELIDYLASYTDDVEYLDGLRYAYSHWSETEQRKHLKRYVDAAKAVQPETLTGRLGKKMYVYFSASITGSNEKMYISINPVTKEISQFTVHKSVTWS